MSYFNDTAARIQIQTRVNNTVPDLKSIYNQIQTMLADRADYDTVAGGDTSDPLKVLYYTTMNDMFDVGTELPQIRGALATLELAITDWMTDYLEMMSVSL